MAKWKAKKIILLELTEYFVFIFFLYVVPLATAGKIFWGFFFLFLVN